MLHSPHPGSPTSAGRPPSAPPAHHARLQPRRPQAERGFTLVEVLIAGAISTLLLTALVQIFTGAFDLSRIVRERDELLRDAERGVALLRRDVSSASRIASVGASELVLFDAQGDTVRYSYATSANGALMRQAEGDSARVAAGNLASLGFTLHTVARPVVSERVQTCYLEDYITGFREGDWDSLVNYTNCNYNSRGERRVENTNWCAEEFWNTPAGQSFTRASFRACAKDHYPAEVDLVVEIYVANVSGYPGTLVAQGKLSRWSLGYYDYQWHEVTLTRVGTLPIEAGGHYWLVFRPYSTGSSSYAGHVQFERIKDCDSDDWPSNEKCYRSSDNSGSSWSTADVKNDLFCEIYGLLPVDLITEVTQSLADTVGVSYRLAFDRQGESAYRGGFVALHDL